MTRKHFEKIAVAIALIKDRDHRVNTWRTVSEAFQATNPRFNASIFRAACNIDGKE